MRRRDRGRAVLRGFAAVSGDQPVDRTAVADGGCQLTQGTTRCRAVLGPHQALKPSSGAGWSALGGLAAAVATGRTIRCLCWSPRGGRTSALEGFYRSSWGLDAAGYYWRLRRRAKRGAAGTGANRPPCWWSAIELDAGWTCRMLKYSSWTESAEQGGSPASRPLPAASQPSRTNYAADGWWRRETGALQGELLLG